MEKVKRIWREYPTLANWFVLAVGMVIILYLSARHIGFSPRQWSALVGATIILAGLSAWIISWE